MLGDLLQTVVERASDPTTRWPGRQTSNWAITCFVLAGCVLFLFPVSHAAGTETTGARLATAFLLVGSAILLRSAKKLAEPGAALHLLALALGVVVPALLYGLFALTTHLHAPWLFALWALTVVHVAAAPIVVGVWRRVFPADAARVEEEATTDILESIATAFILALVVREFAFEAFKIPTGSMEPTICGDYEGVRRRDRMLEDEPWLLKIVRKMPFPAGDRLLAAKTPLLFAPPQRWSIIVFKYPLFRQTNFIKRLIGLSGEHVEIRQGDIYIDGKIAAKPDDVQETLWFPVLPDASGEWRGEGVSAEFVADNGGKWTFTKDGAEGSADAEKTAWIVHDSGLSDVRVSFDVDASKLGGGSALVRLDGSGRRVEVEAKADGVWLTAPGVAKTKLDVAGLGSGTTRLSVAVADRVARVYEDGRIVARVETADQTNLEGMGDHVAIGVTGGGVKIAKLKIERDLAYSPASGDMPGDWRVPQGHYFMLGDNTNQSRDSRAWKGRVFHLKSGEEVVADDASVRLDDDTSVPSVRDEGEVYDVLDSFGVERRIKKTDVEGGSYRTEPRPFVRREDLVGRAFLVFFPFPPFGEWRPRILP